MGRAIVETSSGDLLGAWIVFCSVAIGTHLNLSYTSRARTSGKGSMDRNRPLTHTGTPVRWGTGQFMAQGVMSDSWWHIYQICKEARKQKLCTRSKIMQNQYRNNTGDRISRNISQMSSVDPLRQGAEEQIQWRHGGYTWVSKSNLKVKSWHLIWHHTEYN